MKNKNEKLKTVSATEIHYRILEIGADNSEEGISFQYLKSTLKSEGLISNIDNDEHLKEWFGWSYAHRELGCTCPRRKKNDCGCIDDEDQCNTHEHLTLCKHFLQKDALVDFAQLKQSRIAEKNAKQAKIESRNAFKYAVGAMIISALSLIPDYWNMYCSTTSEIKKELSEIKLHILSKSNERESLKPQVDDNSLQSKDVEEYSSTSPDSSNLEEVRKVLETSDEIISTYDE